MILAHHLELVDSKESFNDEITSSIERETTKKTCHHFFLIKGQMRLGVLILLCLSIVCSAKDLLNMI